MRRKVQLGRMMQPLLGAHRFSATGIAAQALSSLAAILVSYAAADAAEARNPKKPNVVIWKDQDAQNRARTLIDGGALKSNPAAVQELVACIVPNGTQLTVENWRGATDDVRVTSGKFAGCAGNVMKDYVAE